MEQSSWREVRWHFCLWTWLTALVLINPIGYVGGGWDDWHYLTAARCWAEIGPCLPSDHWEGRWPVFAPTALIFELFGESRLTLGVWPLAASMTSASLIAIIGNRLFHSPVGWLAAAMYVATPAFSIQLIGPSAEAVELAFLLGGVLLVIQWLSQGSKIAAFASGLCFAMAFQVKETSLIAAAMAGCYVMARRPRAPELLAAALGFALPILVEFMTYWSVTGDALYRRNLSLSHIQVPSTELQVPVSQGSPILNKSVIAGWRREPGLHVHWSLDGIINLLANGKAGLTLWLAPLSLLVLRQVLSKYQRRAARFLLGCALLYIAMLIFVLAVDPKPRMMFAPLVGSTMALAITVVGAWRAGRRLLPVVMVGAQLVISITILFGHPRTNVFDGPAEGWIGRLDGTVAVDLNTSRHLAMIPAAEGLPGLESHRPHWLRLSLLGCGVPNSTRNAAGRKYKLVNAQRSTQPSLPGVQIPLELCVYRQATE